jgi:hypothetical protein
MEGLKGKCIFDSDFDERDCCHKATNQWKLTILGCTMD